MAKDPSKYNTIKIRPFKEGWARCPSCGKAFMLADKNSWSGLLHIPCGQRLKIEGHSFHLSFVWGLVANVFEGGSSRFKAGAKITLYPPLWGDGYENIKVIGKDFESGKFIEIIMNHKKIINPRIVKLSKPDMISRLIGLTDDSEASKEKMKLLKDRLLFLNKE